jgi:hypothetical protein
VRIRITRHLKGSIDGIPLGRFEAGEVYEIGTSLSNYLMACGYATPLVDEQATSEAVGRIYDRRHGVEDSLRS